jgi:Kef-type K+ transport system membrane component KefB
MTAPSSSPANAALARLDRANRRVLQAIIAAAVVEAVLLMVVLVIIDFSDPVQRLVFLAAMLTYFTLGLGLVALGAHVSRTQERLLNAIELLRR